MPNQNTLVLTFLKPINISVQPGDAIYGTDVLNHISGYDVGHLDNEQENPFVYLGTCAFLSELPTTPKQYLLNINPVNPDLMASSQTGFDPDTMDDEPVLPKSVNYIMFTKNHPVNTSNLKGYFAEIELRNNSKEKAELFSVGTVVTPSSK